MDYGDKNMLVRALNKIRSHQHIFISIVQILLITIILTDLSFASSEYPREWWKAFPKDPAKSWEILPQEAAYGKDVILSKRTELGIFSNFAATPFTLDGKQYASVEGFWQMMKYPDPQDKEDPRYRKDLIWKYTREEVAQLTGFEAKEAGDATKENYQKLEISFISYKGKRMEYKDKDKMEHYELIFRAIQSKIDQNEPAKKLLAATGTLILRPDHIQDADAPPAYRYYDILIKIRSNLQN
ncbi:MAG: NADAR family protein [Deltaproteobacteria bacterium]|nr:NADAR family protein [Deltaproteobacteria bacterium]